MTVKPLRHSKARRWIQARADGALDVEETTRLDAHLQECPSCQAYAAEFLAFDAGLRRRFQARRVSRLEEHFFSQPRALDTLYHNTRVHMNHNQITKYTSSLSFAVLMVILGIGLTFILSIGIHAPQPGQKSTLPVVLPSRAPTGTATPTQPPFTEASPLTDPTEIAVLLNSLAGKNAAAFQNGEWMHTRRQDLSEAGMIQSSAADEWTRLPAAGEACAPFLAIVRDGPQDGQLIQIRLNLPDGTSGDLTNLRQGQGQVEQFGPEDRGCQLSMETTAAGQLAPYIDQGDEPPLAKKPTKLIEARAWYSELEGRPTFVVAATFEDQGVTSEEYRQTYEETRHFDLQTGTLLREHVVMKWSDGSLFGESLTGYQVEFLPKLPQAVAQELDTYASELRLEAALQAAEEPEKEQIRAELAQLRQSAGILASNPAQANPGSEEPTQGAPQVSLDDLAYSLATPLTDPAEIGMILEALQARSDAKFSQPGWYLYGPAEPDPENWIANRYILTHKPDPASGCEDLIYYIKEGAILPQQIDLNDGRWGLMGVVEDGAISQAGRDGEACRPESLGMDYPANELASMRGRQDGTVDGVAQAWVEQIDGRRYFVLNYDTQFSQSHPVVMDPDTRKLEPEIRQQEWKYYDLEWGVNSGWAAMYYLENGKILGEPPVEGVVPTYSGKPLEVVPYDELPPQLAQVFADTVAKLDEYLGRANP